MSFKNVKKNSFNIRKHIKLIKINYVKFFIQIDIKITY